MKGDKFLNLFLMKVDKIFNFHFHESRQIPSFQFLWKQTNFSISVSMKADKFPSIRYHESRQIPQAYKFTSLGNLKSRQILQPYILEVDKFSIPQVLVHQCKSNDYD